MDREQLKEILPHREPMLLLDSCNKTSDISCEGEYKIRGDEFFLKGHFPEFPIVPGVILCEIMAQSSCLIFAEDIEGHIPFYAGIKNAKFKKSVLSGDTVTVENTVKSVRKPFYVVYSSAYVEGELAASGELTFCLKKISDLKI